MALAKLPEKNTYWYSFAVQPVNTLSIFKVKYAGQGGVRLVREGMTSPKVQMQISYKAFVQKFKPLADMRK